MFYFFQVSVLTDQIEVQTEKLDELNSQCNEVKHRLSGADSRLQEVILLNYVIVINITKLKKYVMF